MRKCWRSTCGRIGGGFGGDDIERRAIAIPHGRTLTAPPPPKLIPKGNYGISIWVHVLLDKYSSYRPTERLLGQLEQYDLDLPAGTVNDGLKRIEPMLKPIYEALLQRNRLGGLHQADETRWRVFVLLDGKKGHGWWLWVILGADTVVYLLDSSRSHEVPESHFGPAASGALEVDRYSGYKAMAQVKSGLMVLAFCWATCDGTSWAWAKAGRS